tara:strand:+ start:62 stop:496 length:435 start_codon:yes stop_codon:yes gene_type:complete
MDTEDTLKKKWKIRRDVRDRGYSVQKVLESIKNRESDFNKFIEPQKENADLIVNFFSRDEINLNEYNEPERLSLKLSINKKFVITKILDRMDSVGISYVIDNCDEKFITLTFDEYKDVTLFKDGSIVITNTFYDYIMYFTFNMV